MNTSQDIDRHQIDQGREKNRVTHWEPTILQIWNGDLHILQLFLTLLQSIGSGPSCEPPDLQKKFGDLEIRRSEIQRIVTPPERETSLRMQQLNPHPLDYKMCALPLCYNNHCTLQVIFKLRHHKWFNTILEAIYLFFTHGCLEVPHKICWWGSSDQNKLNCKNTVKLSFKDYLFI